jgi:hypothetical protein
MKNSRILLVILLIAAGIALFAMKTCFLPYHEMRVLLLGDRTKQYEYSVEEQRTFSQKPGLESFALKWYFKPEARIFHDDTGARISYYPEAIVDDVDGDGNPEVFIASYTKKAYCLDGKTGKVLWSYKLPFGITAGVTTQLIDTDGDGRKELIFGTHAPLPIRVYCLRTEKDLPDSKRLMWYKDVHGDFIEGGLASLINNNNDARIIYGTRSAAYIKGSIGVLNGKGNLVNRPTFGLDIGSAVPSVYTGKNGRTYAISGSHKLSAATYKYSSCILAKDVESGELVWVARLGWDTGYAPVIITDIDLDGKKEGIVVPVDRKGMNVILDPENGSIISRLPYKYIAHFQNEDGNVYVLGLDEKNGLHCFIYGGEKEVYSLDGSFDAVKYLLDIDGDSKPEFLQEFFYEDEISLFVYDAANGNKKKAFSYKIEDEKIRASRETSYDGRILADCDNDGYWEIITLINGYVCCFDTPFAVKADYPRYHTKPFGNKENSGFNFYNNYRVNTDGVQ